MRSFLASALLLTTATFINAQDVSIARAGLPHAVEARLLEIEADPATRKITGTETINENYTGNLIVYGGPLILSAAVQGELIMVDGNVEFTAGSAVSGDVTVINGEAIGLEQAEIGGTITMYGEGFTPFRSHGRVMTVNNRTRRVYREDYRRHWGHSHLSLRTGWNYNRVEGLPVHFGPVIQTGGHNPTRIEALAIWRTDVSSPWDSEELGYLVRVEQFLGGHRNVRLGGSLRSVVDPIESWQMNKLETSLAAFVLHEDFRDYFLREGWSAYLQFTPRASGVQGVLEYRDERHASQAARDPWTLFNNSERWRLQPLIAEGRLRTVNGSLEVDRRDDDDFATAGYLLRGEVTHGMGGSLQRPGVVSPIAIGPVEFDEKFASGLIDARVYRRVGSDATLSLRLVGAGSLNNKSLPPQFQRALGGPGSVPGYATLSADCGARNIAVATSGTTAQFFPYYGCDRTAHFSAEYRGGFDFHWGGLDVWDDDDHWNWDIDANPNWLVFFDAARGWAHEDSEARGAVDTATLYDIGAGILLGDVGVYAAVPLTGTERGARFFIRLGPRF